MEKQIYSYDEAYEESLRYFQGDELAARVWVNKYAVKDSFGNIYEKSPEDMHWRIANEVARIESKYPNGLTAKELYDLLDHFKYIVPQGSPMTGIGNDYQVASLSNCFVIGVDGAADSYGAIIKIDEEQVQLMKRRGGVGHDLSHIRPKGSPVKNSALTSTGLVPFMERYSNSTREVAQDGRRGALMLSVSIKHPDSEAFIDAKMTEGKPDHYYCYVCSRNYADTFSAICSLQFQTSNAAIHSIFRKSTAWCDFFHAGGLLPATCFLTAGQSWITGADRNSSDSWTSPVEKTNVVVYCRRYGLLYASYPVYLLRKTRI